MLEEPKKKINKLIKLENNKHIQLQLKLYQKQIIYLIKNFIK